MRLQPRSPDSGPACRLVRSMKADTLQRPFVKKLMRFARGV